MSSRVGRSTDGERDLAAEALAQRLRELPSELAPPLDWSELRRRSRLRARSGFHPRGGGAGPGAPRRRAVALAACAALLALVVLVTARVLRTSPPAALSAPPSARATAIPARTVPRPEAAAAPRPDTAAPQPEVAASQPDAAAPQAPEELLARAASAERWLASEPDDTPIVHVSIHLAVASLEDRVASMDDLLNLERLRHARASRLRALQLQRAQLLDSLAQVRYAELLAEESP